ncbi:MAG: hypothetical protein ACREQN_00175 [Candidatus Binataceae bacterium]
MNVPVSGLILLPLTLGIFCFSSYLAEWAIFCAVLQGAALVNLGGGFAVGLSPYFFVTALIALSVVPQWLTGRMRFFADEPVTRHARILVTFVLWCALSAFVLPKLFEGLPVDSPRIGVDRAYFTQMPLHWSFSNAGQAGYMILDLILVLRLLQLSAHSGRLERLVNAFSWSGMFVAAVGVYQMVSHWTGLPFPSWLFNSNQAWAEAPNQLIGAGFSRITATFVEPSEAASFLAAWSVFELSFAIGGGRRNGRHWLCAAVGSVLLVATASTTGYVTAAVMWMVMAWDCVSTLLRYGVIKVKGTLAALGPVFAGLVALAFAPSAWLLLDAVVLNKGQSASALHRAATFGRAVEVFVSSWGLGVGLGSNRAMSAFFYVLSNLGVPGVILIGWLLLQLYLQVRAQLSSPYHDRTARIFLYALGAAFIANLLALLVSGAEITQPRFWVLWGLLLATVRYNWLRERRLHDNTAAVAVAPEAGADRIHGYRWAAPGKSVAVTHIGR